MPKGFSQVLFVAAVLALGAAPALIVTPASAGSGVRVTRLTKPMPFKPMPFKPVAVEPVIKVHVVVERHRHHCKRHLVSTQAWAWSQFGPLLHADQSSASGSSGCHY